VYRDHHEYGAGKRRRPRPGQPGGRRQCRPPAQDLRRRRRGARRVVPRHYRRLSGGQKQRLSIALALIGSPQIAILDELTTGLDPQARRDTWELIEHIRDRGVTVILVTHYMDEAERLCDRVLLIDHGLVTVPGTPAGLAQSAGGGMHLRFVPSIPFDIRVLTVLPEVTEVGREGQRIRVTGTGDLVGAVIRALEAAGVQARGLQVESASLDDAYVRLIKEAQQP
jgi:ABC-2 type transport system ATP-binding protein